MIYYETLVLLFILLAIIPILLGFVFKKKPIRYFLWILSLPGLFLTISTILKHTADIKLETSKFCGSFIIDITKSKYSNIDLTKHKNLLLKVSPDHKFQFIADTIPFIKQEGTWKFTDNEDVGYLECFFDSKSIKAYRSYDNQVWTFESDCLINSTNSDIIYFNRLR